MLNRHYAALNQHTTNAAKYTTSAAEAVFASSRIEQNDVGRIAIILQTAVEHCRTEAAGSGVACRIRGCAGDSGCPDREH